MDEGRAYGTLPLSAELLIIDRFGVSEGHFLWCMPIGELNRLQLIVPNSWSRGWAWLDSVGHKTKQKDMAVKKEDLGVGVDRRGRQIREEG